MGVTTRQSAYAKKVFLKISKNYNNNNQFSTVNFVIHIIQMQVWNV